MSYWAEVRHGVVATIPLWLGMIPFALAFGVLARAAGFSAIETQAFSALVFAGASQVAAVTLTAGGAAGPVMVVTCLLINLRHVLYGLSLARMLPNLARPARALLAFLMTDEGDGLTIGAAGQGHRLDAVLLGTGIGLTRLSTVVPPALDRFLAYVPAAAFAALAAPGVFMDGGDMAARIAGAIAAILVLLRVRGMWAGIAAGMLVFWMVRMGIPTVGAP